MEDTESSLGNCPTCDAPIRGAQLLVKYQSDDRIVVLAECPSCAEIVYPQ